MDVSFSSLAYSRSNAITKTTPSSTVINIASVTNTSITVNYGYNSLTSYGEISRIDILGTYGTNTPTNSITTGFTNNTITLSGLSLDTTYSNIYITVTYSDGFILTSNAVSGTTSSSTMISINNVSNSSITVNYTLPSSYGTPTGAKLYYGTPSSLKDLTYIGNDARTITTNTLSPSTTYSDIYIIVTYSAGFTLKSNVILGTVTMANTTISVGAVTSTSIRINYIWPSPPLPTTATLYYGTTSSPTTTQDIIVTDTSCNVISLNPSTSYYYYIYALYSSSPYLKYSQTTTITLTTPSSTIISVFSVTTTSIIVNYGYNSLTSYGQIIRIDILGIYGTNTPTNNITTGFITNGTITLSGLSGGITYSIYIIVTYSNGFILTSDTISGTTSTIPDIMTSALAYYSFDGNVTDLPIVPSTRTAIRPINAVSGTTYNGEISTSSKVGSGALFTRGRVKLGLYTVTNVNQISIAFWVNGNPDSYTNNICPFILSPASDYSNQQYMVLVQNNSSTSYRFSPFVTANSAADYYLNTGYQHIVCTFNDKICYMYVNGTQVRQVTSYNNPVSDNKNFYVGLGQNGSNNGTGNFYIDDLYIFDGVLSLTDVQSIYRYYVPPSS